MTQMNTQGGDLPPRDRPGDYPQQAAAPLHTERPSDTGRPHALVRRINEREALVLRVASRFPNGITPKDLNTFCKPHEVGDAIGWCEEQGYLEGPDIPAQNRSPLMAIKLTPKGQVALDEGLETAISALQLKIRQAERDQDEELQNQHLRLLQSLQNGHVAESPQQPGEGVSQFNG